MLFQPRQAFLQERILDLQQALFFNYSPSVLRFPISIINLLRIDEVGNLWFAVNRPVQHINEFDREFNAKLDFYKKGKDYYIHVKGKAWIITDPEEINNVYGISDEIRKLALTGIVLIRMKVEETFYYPAKKQASNMKPAIPKINLHSSAVVKGLQYIIKDIIPVFQSH